MQTSLRKVVILVALLNLAYFGIEFGTALRIGSVSLFADSVDFLEDTFLNCLVAFALGWSAPNRARVGAALAFLLFIPSVATAWMFWAKLHSPVAPAAVPLSVTGAGALVVNFTCAAMLMRFRMHSGSLTRAAFLSARNDTIANVAIIAAGALTALTHSGWPDLMLGAGIIAMNLDASRQVWRAAKKERTVNSEP